MESASVNNNKSVHACNRCRSSKRKCSGDLPNCSRCLRLGRECSYAARDSKSNNSPSQGADVSRRSSIFSVEGSQYSDSESSGLSPPHTTTEKDYATAPTKFCRSCYCSSSTIDDSTLLCLTCTKAAVSKGRTKKRTIVHHVKAKPIQKKSSTTFVVSKTAQQPTAAAVPPTHTQLPTDIKEEPSVSLPAGVVTNTDTTLDFDMQLGHTELNIPSKVAHDLKLDVGEFLSDSSLLQASNDFFVACPSCTMSCLKDFTFCPYCGVHIASNTSHSLSTTPLHLLSQTPDIIRT